MEYDYFEAFSRNLGFLSLEEQTRLRNARVAIAGLGGTGGAQVHALSRMGIGRFHLADPDTFELVNFNRQSGAIVPNIGRLKTEVARETILAINPEADILTFDSGVGVGNIDAFLEGVDVVVDSMDFYCFEERFLLYGKARAKGLWVLTAPPLGFGFTLLMFDPKGMKFEDYFGFHSGMTERQRIIALIAGVAPKPFMLKYLDRSRPDFAGRRLPSVGAAPFMIAGVMATEVTRILTGKGKTLAVPTIYQFDALLRRFRKKTYYWGMKGPLQRLKRAFLNRMLPL
ncbi:MAG: ThiF family adenylyltransferase [Burkholderiales bacterium]|nr:ThiF family adenylyltransferase [Burkholderiales bacterium]